MAKGTDTPGQVPHRLENESKSSPVISSSYYSARPQSQLIEPGYVVSGPTKTASPLPQCTSMPVVTTDTVVGNRGQFGQQSSAVAMSSVGTTMYSDDQRYRPQQPQVNRYDQQPAMSVPPQFNQAANMRPQMPEMVRQPLPGMVPPEVYQPGSNRHSNLPTVHPQPPAFGKNMQYQPSSPTLAVGSEQKPNYYSARPQSQLMEPGYVTSGPTKTASPLPQSSSVPVVTTDSAVGNRGQMSTTFGQQSSSISKPVYSDYQRYKPQEPQPNVYNQQSSMPVPSPFNQTANVRPQMPEMVRHPLPGMVPQDMQHPGTTVRSNLPSVHQQPVAVGSGTQYRPPGVQSATGIVGMTPPSVQYDPANVGSRMPAVTSADGRPVHSVGVHYVGPNTCDGRPAPPQDMQYETANVENRAAPAGIPFSGDGRLYAAHGGLYRPPRVERPEPGDIRYGMQNFVGAMPAVRPVVPGVYAERNVQQAGVRYGTPHIGGEMPPTPSGVRYDTPSSEDRLAEPVPAGSHVTSRDQSSVVFTPPAGYYESPNAAVGYTSQDVPYRIHGTSGTTPVVPANVHYETGQPPNVGDSWPSPPPSGHYGAPNVRSDFSVPTSVNVPPPAAHVPVPQPPNAVDGSKSFPSEVRPRVQNIVTSVPPGMPTTDVRPKKQPPPIAAKPKLPVSPVMAMTTKEVTKDEGKQLKPEKMQQKILEIQRLESRPYLTGNEQMRLRNLRIEVEFDKRLADLNDKREDDSDLPQSRMFPPTVRFVSYLKIYSAPIK